MEDLPAIKLSNFQINGIDFGTQDMVLIDLSPEISVDGILGISFLREYAVFLDFSKHVAYIGESKEVL